MATTPDCLRYEAKMLRRAAKCVFAESEDLLARATALNRSAQRLEAMADEREDIERIQALAGRPVRLAKKQPITSQTEVAKDAGQHSSPIRRSLVP